LTDAEASAYLMMADTDREGWMRAYWASLDPTPTTPENERHDAHYRRLAYAMDRFAIDDPPGWDRRGELLIRYGPPDQRDRRSGDVVEGLGLVPPAEVWIYFQLSHAFQLEDITLKDNFQDSFERQGSGRVDLQGNIAAMQDVGSSEGRRSSFGRQEIDAYDVEAEMRQRTLKSMMQRGQTALRETPHVYLHDYGGASLEYVFDVLNFAGPAGEGDTRVEVNLAVASSQLEYRDSDVEGIEAVLEVEGLVQDPDYQPVARTAHTTRNHRLDQTGLGESLVLDRLAVRLPGGEYRLALSLRDSLSGNVGIYRTEILVREFPPGVLALSDIQVALDVDRAEPGDPYAKGGFRVTPYPAAVFPPGRDVFLFFEVYGLAVSPAGESFYEVEFTIRPVGEVGVAWFGTSRGKAAPGVGTAYDGVGVGARAAEFIALDPETLKEGTYEVEILVTDRVSDAVATERISFACGG
jgi:GWxTD domain-containing protein